MTKESKINKIYRLKMFKFKILILFVIFLTFGCQPKDINNVTGGCSTKEISGPTPAPVGGGINMQEQSKKILMVIAPQNFRDEEYNIPKKILSDAGYKVITASKVKTKVKGMLGTVVTPDVLLSEINVQEYVATVFVGGSGAQVYWNDESVHHIVHQSIKDDQVVSAICIAPVILAKAGILKNRKATVFPSSKTELVSGGANYTGAEVEVDGRIVTASGPEAAELFGTKILELLKTK